MAWLTLAVFVNSLISLFYYLRWIIPALSPAVREAAPGFATSREVPRRWSASTAVVAALLSIGLGIAGGAVYAVASGPLWP